jgi:O-antigen/teichoic acid export membrane protein
VKLPSLQFENRKLLKNTSWLLVTEISAKISRLLVIFALAANLTAIEYGTVMLALACHEVFKIMLRSGAGAQIVQCSEQDLTKFAKNGALIQWLVCLLLAGLQTAIAIPLAHFYDNQQLITLLSLMAVVYLFYPIVSVKVFLVQRVGDMRFYSIRNALCIFAENLSIAIFAWLDFGIMSVVYGKWVFAILWVGLFYFSPVKAFGIGFDLKTFLRLLRGSSQLVCTELVRAVRMQLDMLIGARLLSPELFGLYSFAKSAGVGLSQSINNAFNGALYPYLCNKYRQGELRQNTHWIYILTAAVAMLFVLQAFTVPFYVPILFEQQWQQNFPVVILLCLAAVPGIFIDTHCSLIRATAAYKKELYVRLFCLIVSAIGLMIFSADSPEKFALSILISSGLWLAVLVPWRGLYEKFYLQNKPKSMESI